MTHSYVRHDSFISATRRILPRRSCRPWAPVRIICVMTHIHFADMCEKDGTCVEITETQRQSSMSVCMCMPVIYTETPRKRSVSTCVLKHTYCADICEKERACVRVCGIYRNTEKGKYFEMYVYASDKHRKTKKEKYFYMCSKAHSLRRYVRERENVCEDLWNLQKHRETVVF